MSRWLRWTLVIVAAVVVLAAVALAAIPYLVDTPRVQALIASNASPALGRPVRFQSFSISVLPLPAVELRGLEVAEDPQFGKDPFLRLDTGRIRLKLGPLLTGRVELGEFRLKKPVIAVIQQPDGHLNIGSLGAGRDSRPPARPGGGRAPGGDAGAGAGALLASSVFIEDGVVTYVTQGAKGPPARYRIEGLDLKLEGDGTSVTFKGDAKVKPGDLTVKISDGTIATSGARTLTEAPVRAKVAVDSKDIAELAAVAAGPATALGGGLKGTLAVGGTLGAPTAAGDVEMSRLSVTQISQSCPEPKRRTLTLPTVKLNTAWQDNRLVGRPLNAALGNGTITTQLVVTLDRGVKVQMNDLGIKALPLDKVLVDFLCQGYAVTGPLDLTGALGFSPSDVFNTLTGPGQLRIGAGKVVGSQALALLGSVVRVGGAVSSLLNADLPTTIFNSPLEFDSITGNYVLTNGVFTTKDLLYTSRAMKVGVAGEYGLATGRMNLDMVITTGRGEMKAKVTGTSASPSIRVAPSTILRDVDPGKVQKGLGDLLKRVK
ncbi:MAG TPA: AsmA-like C-terminal region-containing protein [Methylomirabilota bacterium]|nr:AsmA-like C-terminal region-containing protein [Methylomirabilota bacterium]